MRYKMLKIGSRSRSLCSFIPFCVFTVSKVPMKRDLFDIRIGTAIMLTAIKDKKQILFSSKNPGGLNAVMRG
ncbi:MAG: hypothetical protein N2V72_07660 [Methanophagales archaeon]|nr:hypothetical protein [Methanophagales archaeon]